MLFDGMSTEDRAWLRSCGSVRKLDANTILFREGDPAYGLFTILSGKVSVLKKTTEGEEVINTLGENDVFGEMGLFGDLHRRTATVQVVEPTMVFEISADPVELSRRIGRTDRGIALVRNLVKILARRLQNWDAPHAQKIHSGFEGMKGYDPDPEKALGLIERLLPTGMLKSFFAARKLKTGEELCHQGDAPDGFYFLREGCLEVFKEEPLHERGPLGQIQAPAIAGELGFFANEPRSATLRARIPCELVAFRGKDFEALRKKSPEDALRLMLACAQLVVELIRQRETA